MCLFHATLWPQASKLSAPLPNPVIASSNFVFEVALYIFIVALPSLCAILDLDDQTR